MLSVADLFKGSHFDREIIILCVRWYLRFKLSTPRAGRPRGFVASLVHESGFQSAKTAFHRCVVLSIVLSNFPSGASTGSPRPRREPVRGGGVLPAAAGMVEEPGRRLLPLYGRGQGGEGHVRLPGITPRPWLRFCG